MKVRTSGEISGASEGDLRRFERFPTLMHADGKTTKPLTNAVLEGRAPIARHVGTFSTPPL